MRITCPHCGRPAKVRTSRAMSPITREAYVQCENIDCCHVFRVFVSAIATIVPSIRPNPAVYLRPSARRAANAEGQGELPFEPGGGTGSQLLA
ncbi:MAG: ogr/Delta-like zinc finger family protein [Candidatus Accumulibacter sp.]|jgi:hypothetical protein|nr:ogr/Delta-like zinc finger family protein [Accumulibacter sp.]